MSAIPASTSAAAAAAAIPKAQFDFIPLLLLAALPLLAWPLIGSNSTWASIVPASRLSEIHTMVRRNSASLVRPSTTSSVSTESCGSIRANSRIVAKPLTTAESCDAVTRNSGLR